MLLIRFMLVMAPVVLIINGYTKGDWWEAALFALSVAGRANPGNVADDRHLHPRARGGEAIENRKLS
ncbi:magnesium-transporting ATPase MgtA [Salmonella enterica subsp. salamae]|uniref:Magnesium-transporting ATPase MgtA n=1 Tax=Salmonella enterica subsp. salamae TaxID=59202 RepID=A0A6D2GF46_SALER|nr:magnesium-transporting ATPase MgtA [Salmonella enterica subsp. salamae]